MYRISSLISFALAIALSTLHAQTSAPPSPSPDSQSQSSPTTAPPVPYVEDDSPAAAAKEPPKEDWTTISLAKSNVQTQLHGGFLINKVDMPGGCTREMLRMQWRHGDPIDLYVVRPPHEGKLPVVLFLYNYTYDTDLFREDRWCGLAKRNGFMTAAFASALSWQRFHAPRPMKQWFVSEMQEALGTSAHDVQMMLNYLQSRPDTDMQHVAMFGQGSGGSIAILAAAADPRIGALDLMDPWGDWPDWLKGSKQVPEEERADYLKPEFLAKISMLDPVDYLPQLKGRPVRIQQVTSDPVTPLAAMDKIAAAVPKGAEVMRFPDLPTEAKSLGPNGIVGWLGRQVNAQPAETPPVRSSGRQEKRTSQISKAE